MKNDEEKLRAQGVSDLTTSVLSPKLGHDLTTSDYTFSAEDFAGQREGRVLNGVPIMHYVWTLPVEF